MAAVGDKEFELIGGPMDGKIILHKDGSWTRLRMPMIGLGWSDLEYRKTDRDGKLEFVEQRKWTPLE
jgi:hypothetical protein